jgi:hypothetical protein
MLLAVVHMCGHPRKQQADSEEIIGSRVASSSFCAVCSNNRKKIIEKKVHTPNDKMVTPNVDLKMELLLAEKRRHAFEFLCQEAIRYAQIANQVESAERHFRSISAKQLLDPQGARNHVSLLLVKLRQECERIAVRMNRALDAAFIKLDEVHLRPLDWFEKKTRDFQMLEEKLAKEISSTKVTMNRKH